MKTALKGSLIIGVILTGGFTGLSGIAAASAPEKSWIITIHVNNDAKVNGAALTRAERAASAVFTKAGIQSQWIDPSSTGERSFPASHIKLEILPSLITYRLGVRLSDSAVGLAPGSGPDRQWVYVFYNRVEALAMKYIADTHGDTAQILGHVIAHEIGHLLLKVQSHSATGIMRGGWDRWDLQNASYGYLHFTPQQAQVIREEVGRRSGN
jgi:hypothetical protein